MKKIILIAVVSVILIGFWFYLRHPLGEKVIINGHTISAEVSVTNAEKERGLGYRNSLQPDHGMLFVYQNKDRYGFWMKGMKFPLDYIWIDGNKVVDLSPNVPAPQTPDESPVELSPRVPVDKVLEVNRGVIDQMGVRIGNTVQFTD